MPWLMARIYDRFMATTEAACLGAWRDELLGGLAGDVLELGAGTGVNLTRYPDSLRSLRLSEPDAHMRVRLEARARALGRRVELLDASAEHIPLPDESVDAVISTLVLCTVEDPERALLEAFRVLRPGGQLVFLEHVCADADSTRFVWQRRLEPAWKRLAGNCHLTRDTATSIEAAGFEVIECTRESMRKALPIIRPTIRGRARRPDTDTASASPVEADTR